MRTTFVATAIDLLERDPRVAVVLAEISTDRFEPALTRWPERAINVGIMEQTLIGVSAGFALEGFHPIAHSLSPFVSERPYEQLKDDFGYQGLGGTFVGSGGSYDYGTSGATHHAPADVSLMLAIPRMEVLVPGHPDEVDALLRATYANGRPTYLRTTVIENDAALVSTPGEFAVLRRGDGPVVLTFGPFVPRVLAASAGLDATIVYAASLRPFDAPAFAAIVGDAARVIVVEPCYEASSAPVVVPALGDRAVRWTFIGVPRDDFIHAYGTPEELDVDLGLDPAGIRRRIA